MKLKTLSLSALSITILAISALGLCSTAYAKSCNSGIYIGGQFGYGQTNYGLSGTRNSTQDGEAGRAYVGYQFNPYFGLETGYSVFSDTTFKTRGTLVDTAGNVDTITGNVKAQTQQWDILAKAGLPFGCTGLRGDIKAGAAYVMSKVNWNVSNSSPAFSKFNASGSESENSWSPALGASLAYNFTKNFAADISYLHTFGSDSKIGFKNDIDSPDTDLATIGLSYLFA